MRKPNSDPPISDLKISELMRAYGFKAEAPTSTARALILNLVRTAYGPEAAREFMRQMNLDQNHEVAANAASAVFKNSVIESTARAWADSQAGSAEIQLSFFDSLSASDQKKSRQA